MRSSLLVAFSLLAVAALAFLADGKSQAVVDVLVGVDADSSGNTATSLGTIDTCRSVSQGETFDVDVWVQNTPQFLGVQNDLNYDQAVLRVIDNDDEQLVIAGPGGGPVFSVSEPPPDEDGSYTSIAVDLAAVGGSGDGVLARVTLEALNTGYSPLSVSGVYLVDVNIESIGDGPDQGDYFDGPFTGAIIWVGQPCPSGANDADGDGVDDGIDNCLSVGNPGQGDRDGDGVGDWCDDGDGDGTLDVTDNCPNTYPGNTLDADGDDIGDICDPDIDGDGVANGSDNAPNIPNADQADTDGDSIPDVLDLDVDGDGIDDKTIVDSINADLDGDGDAEVIKKTLSPLWNGMWESWGNGDVYEVRVHVFALTGSMHTADLDGDGEDEVVIKDPGQPPGAQQSYDLRKNDPDSDIDIVVIGGGDLGLLVPTPEDVDGDGEMESIVWEPELMAGTHIDVDLDLDGDPDIRWQNMQVSGIDNCPSLVNPSQANNDGDAYGDACDDDDDNDGYTDSAESQIGTGAFDRCGTNAWPSDLNRSSAPLDSFNKITILDLTSFLVPVRYFGTDVGTNPGDVRWDLTPGKGVFLTDINIQDITAMLVGPSGYPPMLGGAKAFGGPACSVVP